MVVFIAFQTLGSIVCIHIELLQHLHNLLLDRDPVKVHYDPLLKLVVVLDHLIPRVVSYLVDRVALFRVGVQDASNEVFGIFGDIFRTRVVARQEIIKMA